MTTRDETLWFIECEHTVDHGWHVCEIAATYEHASLWRRFEGYRPLPLIVNCEWMNHDVWYRPVYQTWEELLAGSDQPWVDHPGTDRLSDMESAEISPRGFVTP